MMKLITLVAAFAALSGALMLPALAEEEEVAATVTPCVASVTIDDGSVAYGTLASSEEKNTIAFHAVDNPDGGADGTQIVTNTGTCVADRFLKSSDALRTSGGNLDWQLTACLSVGADAFGHQYEIGSQDAIFDGTDFPDSNDYTADLPGDVQGNGGSFTLDLGICMPAGSTNSAEKTITVTVLLSAQ